MKVLIADKLADSAKRVLEARGLAYDDKPGMSPDELKACLGQYDGILVRSATKLKRDVLAHAGALRVIGRAGVGVDNVDVDAATERGILVMNTPEGNTVSTAEHTFSLLLALTRNIPQAAASVRAGEWKKGTFSGVELRGKTLGIIGLGRIGTTVARFAQGFQMKAVGFDPFMTREKAERLGIELVELDDLLSRSDYITVHTPLTNETRHMINAAAIEKMKPGVRLLNCARGGIIDEEALAAAIESGRVAGAALDVFSTEPPGDNRLLKLDKVIATPHLGASTAEAQEQVAVDAAVEVADYLLDGRIANAVNAPMVDEQVLERLRPFVVLAEKLGAIVAQMVKGTIEAIEVECCGAIAEHDVGPVSIAALKGFLDTILEGGVNTINAAVRAKERGIKIAESTSGDAEEFVSLVRIEARGGKGGVGVAGTVFGKNDPRIVRINGYHVDAHPAGALVLIVNRDVPGAIGKIGMTLGNHRVNIADMTLGRKEEGRNAMVVLNIDGSVPPEAVDELRSTPEVVEVTVCTL
ncbi:MAG: phosphoglycerate dehydrogenase [Verrucomicrobia bacterium]|nr:phosphoglycerate dehydrogenase [Verrucomicrobiota bacterium]